MTFNDLNLHDSRVLQVRLSLDLEENELFEILLRYIEDYATLRTSLKRIRFVDCREVRIVGHLGFVRGNSILTGKDLEDSQLLADTYSKWERLKPRRAWTHFHLLTNTGTEIDVIAAGFEFEDVG